MISKRLAAAWPLLVALAAPVATRPVSAAAQMRTDFALVSPRPAVAIARCGPANADHGAAWETVWGAAALERDAARRSLRTLEDSLAIAVAGRPADAELRYVLAAAIGVRAEIEGGRDQLEAARAAHGRAKEVLSLDPQHPGAKHLIGRLHLEVLRMSRVERFVATKLLGAGELAGATWEEARALLEAGVIGDPCSTEHHFQLARLYVETGDAELARERLRAVLGMAPASARDSLVVARASKLLGSLDAGAR